MDSMPSSSRVPRTLSPDALALLAARAAVALDLAVTAKRTEWTEVRKLGTVLGSWLAGQHRENPAQGGRRSCRLMRWMSSTARCRETVASRPSRN